MVKDMLTLRRCFGALVCVTLAAPFVLPAGCAASVKPVPTVTVATAHQTPLAAGSCAHFDVVAPDPLTSSAYAMEDDSARNVCSVTTQNIGSAEAATLAALSTPGAPAPFTAWDHVTKPARLDAVQKRLGLTQSQTDTLMKQGFVVPDGLTYGTYTEAFHEIYQSELPLWVSVDAIFHAVYRSNDLLIARIERASLMPKLNAVLDAMHCALAASAASYPNDTARDVDLYLTVARSLLAGKAIPSVFGVDAEAKALVARANAAEGIEETTIFGRSRMIDFSVYQPRGHYVVTHTDGDDASASANAPDLPDYFRAATWLSRLELNLVTYDCASSSKGVHEQTPREERAALALADVMKRAHAEGDVGKLDAAWEALAGKREDVSFNALGALAAEAKLADLRAPDVDARLRAVIGRRYPRTARTHYTWEGCSDLPAISTMLGARIVPDSAVTRPLVHSDVNGRQLLGAMDMAYAFGEDRAKKYLAGDLARYPTLDGALTKARALARAPLTGHDLYSAWFGAIRDLSQVPSGTLPSVMRTEPFADLRLSSTVAAFGQIRHNYVLMAAMTYGEAGCEIPDAFVEPAPAVYDGLIEYATRGERMMATLGGGSDEERYFGRLANVLRVLRAIGARELDNRPLPDEALRFLSMVVETTFGTRGTGGSPSFTGWYFDMFHARDEALDGASFLADYYTSSELGVAAYAGVKGVTLGIFVVDTAGGPRVVVGPVADAFEAHEKLPRLGDSQVMSAHAEAPWVKNYVVGGASAPPLALKALVKSKDGRSDTITIEASSTRSLGKVTIELIDHHRRPMRTLTLDVGTKPTVFAFPGKALKRDETPELVQGVHVKVGEWNGWNIGDFSLQFGPAPLFAVPTVGMAWGGMKAPPSAILTQDSPGN